MSGLQKVPQADANYMSSADDAGDLEQRQIAEAIRQSLLTPCTVPEGTPRPGAAQLHDSDDLNSSTDMRPSASNVETLKFQHAMASENAIADGRGQQEVRRHESRYRHFSFFS